MSAPTRFWSKQRKDEVLIDVDDVALGHTTKLRWNESAAWIWSEKIVHPPIIDHDIFEQVQVMASGRATNPARHKPHRAQHPYALRGCVWCGVCGRRMQSYWANAAPYYRCRFPAEYALANHLACEWLGGRCRGICRRQRQQCPAGAQQLAARAGPGIPSVMSEATHALR